MKRFWMLAFLMMGSLAVMAAPALAAKADAQEGQAGTDTETKIEDINTGLGSLSSRMGEVEKTLGVKFFGDVRIRLDWRTQAQSDPMTVDSTGTSLVSGGPINDQIRPRYRLRFGATKQFGDVLGGFRLATSAISSSGVFNNPNSENMTFDQAFTLGNIGVDQAYLAYAPGWLNGQVKLAAGKMPNPLTVSPISWDPDIVPEGFLCEMGNPGTNTKLRATFFYLKPNNSGGAVTAGSPVSLYLTGSNIDEYMANFQLEQLLKLDNDTSVSGMFGYEYVPYVTALTGGNVVAPPAGSLSTNNAIVNADGMIWNFGGTIPNIHMLEAMLTISHKAWDMPIKWTFHGIDNITSFNIPANANVTTLAKMAASGTYAGLSNQYGFYAGLNIGQVKQKNDWAGTLAYGYLEPNAQLGFLTDDDPGYNNQQYFKGILAFGLEDNVTLQITSFVDYHVYYAYLGAANDKLDGTSRYPQFITFFDAMASF